MALTKEISTGEAETASEIAVAAAAVTSADGKANLSRKAKSAKETARETARRSCGIATDNSRKVAAGKIANSKKRPAQSTDTKAAVVLKKLKLPRGATIEILMEATGWQAHSVRGFVSAVVKKRLGLNLVSETGKDGIRRYRIDDVASMSK